MALPYNEWLEIKSGPGTWKIIKALFREDSDIESGKCEFSVRDDELPSKKSFITITIREVHRLQKGEFMIRGIAHGVRDHTLHDRFTAHYNPETRQGSLKLEDF